MDGKRKSGEADDDDGSVGLLGYTGKSRWMDNIRHDMSKCGLGMEMPKTEEYVH